jgi:hypothetical protein
MPTIQREIRYLTADELIRLRRYAEARAATVRGPLGCSRPHGAVVLSGGSAQSKPSHPRSLPRSRDTIFIEVGSQRQQPNYRGATRPRGSRDDRDFRPCAESQQRGAAQFGGRAMKLCSKRRDMPTRVRRRAKTRSPRTRAGRFTTFR